MENQLENTFQPTMEDVPKKKRARQILHEWTEKEITELIEAVELKPELWKTNDPFYKNRNKKEAAWREIGENIFNGKIKFNEIPAKWNNLRVQYKTCAVKYKLKPSGSGRESDKKWKFFNIMNFIGVNDDLSCEPTVSNIPTVQCIGLDNEATKINQRASEVIQSSFSSHSARPKKRKSNEPNIENDEIVLNGIKLAVENMQEFKNDEFNIFGQFVTAEIKRLPNDYQKQKLKRIIQRAIMDFNENLEQEIYAESLNEIVVMADTVEDEDIFNNLNDKNE